MLLSKAKITKDLVALLRSWQLYSGFQVYVRPRFHPGEEEAAEKLARCIIRVPFPQEGVAYLQ